MTVTTIPEQQQFICIYLLHLYFVFHRPELLRPVTKMPSTMVHVAGGTSVIRASPSQGVPMGQPQGITNPQDATSHQTPESVIQDRRYIHNFSRGIGINNQALASHQAHASRILAPGVTVTSANNQATVAILEKVLTSTVPNTAKANNDSQPQDLSNRFRPVDKSGFNSEQATIVVEETVGSSGEQMTGENSGEQEGLLLRANSAAVRDGMISLPEQVSFTNSGGKHDAGEDKNSVVNQAKSELTTLASPFTTNGGAVIITTQQRGIGATAEHVVIHTQAVKEEITVEAKWDNHQQQQQQQQQGQQTYHWSQLVPFITAPNKNAQGQQQQSKGEADAKPTVNGDVTVNGKGPTGSTSEARMSESGQSRRELCGQDVDFDFADDDDVFVPDLDAATTTTTDNKGRTRSLGSFSGKEEPKSPRKVSAWRDNEGWQVLRFSG